MAVLTSINIQSRARMRRANNTRNYIKSLTKKEEKELEEKKEKEKQERILEYNRLADAGNPNSSKEKLIELDNLEDYKITSKILNNPSCPREIIEKYANTTIFDFKVKIAKHNNTPSEIKEAFSRDANYKIRKAVAGSEILPKEMIDRLAKDENSHVRAEIATRNDISMDMINAFINDKDEGVVYSAALNDKYPIEAAINLAKTNSYIEGYFDSVARDDKSDPELLGKLTGLGYFVLRALIENRNTPVTALGKLLNTNSLDLRSKAKERLIHIARYKTLTPEVARDLSKINNRQVLIALSKNNTCPPEILEELSKNPSLTMFSKSLRKFKKSDRKTTIIEKVDEPSKEEEPTIENDLNDGPKL